MKFNSPKEQHGTSRQRKFADHVVLLQVKRDEAAKNINSKVILMIDLTDDVTCDVDKAEAEGVEYVDY